jgi:hypothetical protein
VLHTSCIFIGMPPFAKRAAFHLLNTLSVYTRGQAPVNCRTLQSAAPKSCRPGIRKCSKIDTSQPAKTLHKAKNCRYFQQNQHFVLLS